MADRATSLEDTTLNEVHCFECSKPIPAIPPWLAGAEVKFQCEECRQKHPRVPGMADLEPRRSHAGDEVGEVGEPVDAAEEEEEETEEVDE